MARARTRTRTITRTIKAAAPIIRVSAPRAATKKRHHRRRSHGGGNTLTLGNLGAIAAGGFAVGLIEKTFPTLPVIPLVGKKGTIAIVAFILAKKGIVAPIAKDVARSAAAISGYELGLSGHISGDIAPNVSGIASQV